MAEDPEELVEIPAWVKRVRPDAAPVTRKRTLSGRLREASGRPEVAIDLVEVERDIERLRTDA